MSAAFFPVIGSHRHEVAAYLACTSVAMEVKVLPRELMAALAMGLCLLLLGVRGHGLLLRLGIVPDRLLREDLFSRPALSDSPEDRLHVNPVLFGKFGNVIANTLNLYESAVSFVSCLFRSSGPSTIIWLIVSIIVDAFDRMTGWPLAHIGGKCIERFKPSFAYLYPSTTIVFECVVSGIGATRDYVVPSAVEGSVSGHSVLQMNG